MLLNQSFGLQPAHAFTTAGTYLTLTAPQHITPHTQHALSTTHTLVPHYSCKHTRNAYMNHFLSFFLSTRVNIFVRIIIIIHCNTISLLKLYSVTFRLLSVLFLFFVFLHHFICHLSYSCYSYTLPVCIACLDSLRHYPSL